MTLEVTDLRGLADSAAAELEGAHPVEVLRWAGETFGDRFCLTSSMGDAAAIFVSVSSLLFSFTTLLGWSQYGIKACEYIFGVSSFAVYRFVFVSFTVIGAAVSLRAAWDISDIFNGLMALPNLAGLFFLAPTVRKITENYMVNR